MINAGKYRTLITFEHDQGAKNASGQQVEEWQPLIDQWGELSPLSGREMFLAQQVVSEVTHRVRTRYNPELTIHPRLRLRVGERVFHPTHVLNRDEKDVELELLCAEVI